ncbi:MAG: DUF4349 domain-containing protein [Chloroflexi bacterium]|uniref:DUF4349 domain-containing protein n=1 Tax=Candidatus Chlorohelix allophototropha TaxID=3003348 RepID=A0A8T7LSG5_9CHLR|nr:DUF4349 domain-containing protein [Chloroflexota bacterium]WJW66839.1 DUF4349 domain-containing protein [Chloroflexota bacterium L227-S17]
MKSSSFFSSHRRLFLFGSIALLVLLVGSVAIGIMASPRVGNVFDEVSSGIGYAPQPTAAAAGSAAKAPAQDYASGSTSTSSGSYNIGTSTDKMIIRNATLNVTVENMEKTLADIRALVAQQQGTIFSSNTTVRNEQTYATLVLQIPSGAFDETMTRLRALAYKVDSENTTSQDVTEEYVDLDSQMRNLKATEAQLLDLLKKATNVNETLTVQRELTNVRGEIERRQGRMNYLQKKSDYSLVTLNISPKGAPSTLKVGNNWDFGLILSDAWEGSLRGLQGLATVTVTLAVYGIWLVPLLVLGFYFGRKFYRRFRSLASQQTN